MLLDQASSRHGFSLGTLFGFDGDGAERDVLSVLGPGDVFGVDVYTSIGYRTLGVDYVAKARGDWPDRAARSAATARAGGKKAWVTEVQAEPWEASGRSMGNPRSIAPQDIRTNFEGLKDAGFRTVLLWGAEYWLWRAEQGDRRWLEVVERLLGEEARATRMVTAPAA
jgi:hypothetical protein